jgi:hypothetical protein
MEVSIRQKQHIASVLSQTVVKREFIHTAKRNTVAIRLQKAAQHIKAVTETRVATEEVVGDLPGWTDIKRPDI